MQKKSWRKKKNLGSAPSFTLIFFFFSRVAVWMLHHWGTEKKLQLSAHQWIKESWSQKHTYLESWGQVVLEEPELDRSFGVLQHWQHHDPERVKKTKKNKPTLVATENRGRKSIKGCQFSRILSCFPSADVSEAHLRKRSYRWPEATEKMLITSSFGCFCSSTAPPPVNPLNHKLFFRTAYGSPHMNHFKGREQLLEPNLVRDFQKPVSFSSVPSLSSSSFSLSGFFWTWSE